MLIVTTNEIAGRETAECLGLVSGDAIAARGTIGAAGLNRRRARVS